MNAFKTTLVFGLFCLSGSVALAQPPMPDADSLITEAVVADMRQKIETDIVRISVGAQNERLKALSQDKIDALDKQWRAERESDDKPLIAATLSNPLSIYLARLQGKSIGLYVEIFVMDQNGLNVGQSSITSDFWQGDEAKFQKTFEVSGTALFVDEPEWDDQAKIWRGQVSFTLTEAGAPIGAVTMEVNLTELERRTAAGA